MQARSVNQPTTNKQVLLQGTDLGGARLSHSILGAKANRFCGHLCSHSFTFPAPSPVPDDLCEACPQRGRTQMESRVAPGIQAAGLGHQEDGKRSNGDFSSLELSKLLQHQQNWKRKWRAEMANICPRDACKTCLHKNIPLRWTRGKKERALTRTSAALLTLGVFS